MASTATARRRRQIRYTRPFLYPEQAQFLFAPARYSIVEASTKTGKTSGCLVWLNERACLDGSPGWNGWWVAPVYGQAKIAYERLKRFACPLDKNGNPMLAQSLLKFRDGELAVVYPNGAKLWFKSAEKPDNLYGDDVYAAVLDEASRMREQAWWAIRSTLTATQGQCRIIGNVKGRKNWYFKLARRAQAGEQGFYYAKLTAWHAVAAGVLRREEVEDAERVLPPAVFRELYLAEPSEDGENPFGIPTIRAAMTLQGVARAETTCFGVDLAKSVDWTVACGLGSAGELSHFDRWQASWQHTTQKLQSTIGNTTAFIDSTGVGDPIVETLSNGRSNIQGFKFTSQSKQQLMEGLAMAFHRGELQLWAGPGDVLLNELEAIEFEYTRTGVRYSAPEGMHDDCVMALALAVEARRHAGNAASAGGRTITL